MGMCVPIPIKPVPIPSHYAKPPLSPYSAKILYVNGRVHTNGLENFWSLLKRSLKGTYVAVEPFHLDRYVDEQVFRYNNRATEDNPLTILTALTCSAPRLLASV